MPMAEKRKLILDEWKRMNSDDKSKYSEMANDIYARIAYNLQMEEYRQTEQYKQYQRKLTEWKSTHKALESCKAKQKETKHNEDDADNNNERNKNTANAKNSNGGVSFSLTHIKGDLFSSASTSSLCHCISRDCAMGKGVAKIFKAKFGGVSELKQQNKQIGQCAVLYRGNRYVYYLITKEKYWHKPTYPSLSKTLQDMKAHAVKHGVQHIAMPRIGCGLDRLSWPKVEQIIKDIFKDTCIAVTVCTL